VLLFSGESPATAEAFAVADPYVRNGLVTRWRVRAWTTVVGADAARQTRPAAQPARRLRIPTGLPVFTASPVRDCSVRRGDSRISRRIVLAAASAP
jgi:hypothetical protein